MTDKQPGLRFGPLGEGAVHLCVDMQQMFDADNTLGDWMATQGPA